MKPNTEISLKLTSFGDFTFEISTGELKNHGKLVPLRPKAAQFLRLLIEAEGATVSHYDLYQAIWRNRVVQRLDGLHQLAKDVRKALHDKDGKLVENIPAIGYRFSGGLDFQPNYENRFQFSGKSAYLSGLLTLPAALLTYCVLIATGIVN